jgi:hypothetical protein
MIYTPEGYGKVYFGNRPKTAKTVIRRIKEGMINSNHTSYKLGRHYIIEVPTRFICKVK